MTILAESRADPTGAGRACTICGFRNRAVARFCGDCGESFSAARTSTAARTQLRWPLVVAATVVAVSGAGLWAFFARARTEATGEPRVLGQAGAGGLQPARPASGDPALPRSPDGAIAALAVSPETLTPAPSGLPPAGAPPAGASGGAPAPVAPRQPLPKLTDQDFADYIAGQPDSAAPARGSAAPARGDDAAARAGRMVLVRPGRFWMGAEDGNRNERPRRQVELGAFLIDKFEVTIEEYGRCVEAQACAKPESHGRCNWDWPDRKRHPVNCVSWEQARRYCVWAGKALPTEAQWEKAARGSDGRRHPWGDAAPGPGGVQRMNAAGSGDGYAATAPVGSFPAGDSPEGASDMAGNVAEWTADWFDPAYYRAAPPRDPQGPSAGRFRSVRGGSWFSPPAEARASARAGYPPETPLDLVGFRCARGEDDSEEPRKPPFPSRSVP